MILEVERIRCPVLKFERIRCPDRFKSKNKTLK
jgi:hypothetical protein